MSNGSQLLLNFDQPTSDHVRLRQSRRDACVAEYSADRKRTLQWRGKVVEAFHAISLAGADGLTMREMAVLSGRGINCWTQPFSTLREYGLIQTTELRRDGGVVHIRVAGVLPPSQPETGN